MSVTVPAMRAKMGSRTYYIGKMRASELSGQVGIASELEDWTSLELEDVYQRDLNIKRVTQVIAPYLAESPDRFFGSIIVWARDESVIEFERIMDVVPEIKIPKAYESSLNDLGVIVIGGDGRATQSGLVALDGQHRLAAIREVVQGKTPGPFKGDVANDEITVIFVSDSDTVKTRGLFTILNRTARRVSKNDVLIMSETDGSAMVARKVISSKLLAPRGLDDKPLVKWESNTISKKDTQITTLNAIAQIVAIIARHEKVILENDDDAQVPPDSDAVSAARDATLNWFEILFDSIPEFRQMQEDPNSVVENRKPDKPYSLLMRPVGLIVLFSAVSIALDSQQGGLTSISEAFRRIAKLDWSFDSGLWKQIMVSSKGTITNRQSDLDLASELAAWMITGRTSNKQFQSILIEKYKRQLNRDDAQLPTPVFAS
jgi:DNA sulfur modification protein DndB